MVEKLASDNKRWSANIFLVVCQRTVGMVGAWANTWACKGAKGLEKHYQDNIGLL
jgi:hypothetical protein